METKGISSVLLLSQDGQQHEVEVGRSMLHIHEQDGHLTIYIPRDKADQEFCFESKLPEALTDWLMGDTVAQMSIRSERAALNTVTKLLNCRLSIIARILEHDGIVNVDIPESVTSVATAHGSESEVEIVEEQTDGLSLSTARTSVASSVVATERTGSEVETLEDQADSSSISTTRTASIRLDRHHVVRTFFRASPQDQSSPAIEEDILADNSYIKLLDNVIRIASRSTFPGTGSYNMVPLLEALPDEEVMVESFDGLDILEAFSSSSRFERCKKIGAAGELFVFELLSHLELGFDWSNWESTIRKYVKVHSNYSGMDAWPHRETADIVYEDENGNFTSFLIDKGHLKEAIWQGRTPKFYLEVKTTTGPCSSPFFMSKGQYQKMQEWSNGEDGNRNTDIVYMVMRVFNLGKDSMGVRIYVDLNILRQNGGLEFTAEKWSIVPGHENL
ncbi:hypothetical protein F5884DRAFT_243479 [Xylogone sp. PMI_703]|nr:hypothetical protein F5884DRAFT_243479 [Xylogone sp. PMI_703]